MMNGRYSITGFLFLFLLLTSVFIGEVWANDTTYYVSMSEGNDANDGLTTAAPFQTISRVNLLDLRPGDKVLFKCGDIWRGEMLVIKDSGTVPRPITFSSYPAGCPNKPVLSGSQPIFEWTQHAGNVYRAPLASGANAGLFDDGITQLFRNGQRQLLGRWPNIDANSDGGYSTVDAHNTSQARIRDYALPPIDWTGAAMHIKGIRWYIMNREVLASTDTVLYLNEDVSCYTGNCVGWGYFLNDHYNTLDQEGEWYYDHDEQVVYLYTLTGPPADRECEASIVLQAASEYTGAIILGRHLYEHITDIVIDNFSIVNWAGNGITTPVNLEFDDNERITINNNDIVNVDETGIKLTTWIWNDGTNSGWRGGEDLRITNNMIDGANFYGIDTYSINSLFENNVVRNIGLVKNFNRSGMGCGFTGSNCTENGAGIRVKLDKPAYSGNGNTLRFNHIIRVGMQGVDVFGPNNVIENNFIQEACYTKGDCGGIRTFGRDNFSLTQAKNITISGNIIVDTIGNTDGCHSNYDALFGFGLYIDHYSDAMTISGNTVQNSTAAGILVQNSRATVSWNTMHHNGAAAETHAQLNITGSVTRVRITDNIMYGHYADQLTMSVGSLDNIINSNRNYFYQPYRTEHIRMETDWQNRSLSAWQSLSGEDEDSREIWFSLAPSALPLSFLYYNNQTTPLSVDLGSKTLQDIDQNFVSGSILVDPYSSQILIGEGQIQRVPAINPLLLLVCMSLIILVSRASNRRKNR